MFKHSLGFLDGLYCDHVGRSQYIKQFFQSNQFKKNIFCIVSQHVIANYFNRILESIFFPQCNSFKTIVSIFFVTNEEEFETYAWSQM